MTSWEYRFYGWFYTLSGATLFICALATLLDPTATRIYLGALIFTPFMVYRGVNYLGRYYSDPTVYAPPPPPLPSDPVGLYESLIRDGSPVREVTCAECRQEYVYIPERAAQFQAEKLGPDEAQTAGHLAALANCALAPCPRCGHIQPDMFASCSRAPFVTLCMYTGIFASFIAALQFAYLISETLDSTPGREAPNLTVPWIILGLLVIVGAGSFFLCGSLQRRWDPNSQPQAKRLQLGQQVSLVREVYEKLLQQ